MLSKKITSTLKFALLPKSKSLSRLFYMWSNTQRRQKIRRRKILQVWVIWVWVWMNDASLNGAENGEKRHCWGWKGKFHPKKRVNPTLFTWKIQPFCVFNGNSFVFMQTRWRHYRYRRMLLLLLREQNKRERKKYEIPLIFENTHKTPSTHSLIMMMRMLEMECRGKSYSAIFLCMHASSTHYRKSEWEREVFM